jgi:hypothetical protein
MEKDPPLEEELGDLIEGSYRPLIIDAHELVDKVCFCLLILVRLLQLSLGSAFKLYI